MKCSSCGIEISKAFKAAIQKNICPACSNKIIDANDLSTFIPLCELLSTYKFETSTEGTLKEEDVENLAVKIVSSFNVSDKNAKTVPMKVKKVENYEEDGNIDDVRQQAYEDAIRDQWGMDIEMDAGKRMLDIKKNIAYQKMVNGEGKIKRSE